MSEIEKQLTTEDVMMKNSGTDPALSIIEVKDLPLSDKTQRLDSRFRKSIPGEGQKIADEEKDNPAITPEQPQAGEDQKIADEVQDNPAITPEQSQTDVDQKI